MEPNGTVFLRVKIKSLADEARTIRHEERLAKERKNFALVNRLTDHRKLVVRPASRAAHLAYGYARGIPLSAIESKSKTRPDWLPVERLVKRYGTRADGLSLQEWYG